MSAFVRVIVVGAADAVDVVVPATVPVAEVLPDLAARAGLLDGHRLLAGLALDSPPGRRLAPDLSLADQDVAEDDVVVVRTAGTDPVERYDALLTPPAARRSWRRRGRASGSRRAARRTSSGRGGPAP